MSINMQKAPMPYFGGKARAAPAVWALLGDVEHYVEPFCGTMAVLLNRPHLANRAYHSETVNDADGLLVNAWRAVQLHPDATADAASWPVSEADLHARHIALIRWRDERQLEHLMGDPRWCDPEMAGWWLWGISCWFGGEWCSGIGPWTADDTGRIYKQARNGAREPGTDRRIPRIASNGQGVNHAGLREPGVDDDLGEWHPMTMPELRRWFGWLAARLRHVRIINGDWQRVCTYGATRTLSVRRGGTAGVFLDPPYADTADRRGGLYAVDSLDVAHDVRSWCLEHGVEPDLRIVLAGFDGEHGTALLDAGWTEVEWFGTGGFLGGGMGNIGSKGHQQARERLWASPHCLHPESDAVEQSTLFDV